MKKNNYVFPTILVLLLLFSASFRSTDLKSSNEDTSEPVVIPDSVMTILTQSCRGCHSNEGSGLARGKLNFDNWNNYSPDKQLDKIEEMCEEIRKESMPPKKWRANNPEMVPTEAQTATICNWAASLKKQP